MSNSCGPADQPISAVSSTGAAVHRPALRVFGDFLRAIVMVRTYDAGACIVVATR